MTRTVTLALSLAILAASVLAEPVHLRLESKQRDFRQREPVIVRCLVINPLGREFDLAGPGLRYDLATPGLYRIGATLTPAGPREWLDEWLRSGNKATFKREDLFIGTLQAPVLEIVIRD